MLKPIEMARIRVICLKAIAPEVVKSLHNLSVLHITDSRLPELEKSGALPSYEDVSARLVRIRALLEALGKGGTAFKKKQSYEDPIAEADALLNKSEQVFSLISERDSLSKELDANLASQKALAAVEGISIDFSELSSQSLSFMLATIPKGKAKGACEVLNATKHCAYVEAQGGKGASTFLVALKKGADAKFLEGWGSLSPLPQISSTPKGAIAILKSSEAEIRERLESLGKLFTRLSETLYPHAVSLEEALSIEADRAQIAMSFSSSASLYFIEGWAEARKFQHIKGELHSRFGRKLYISQSGATHNDLPPTLLDNPTRAMPFEFLVKFISMPQYSEIDPSMLLAIIIPLMYALIMGDAGYAAVSFLFSLWMVKKSEKGSFLNQIALIWLISSIPAFLFGIVFDEYFGFTHSHLASVFGFAEFQLYQGFHRLTAINALMMISIIVGILHLSLGFVLGAANEWGHSKKHAAAKLCWLGILLGGFFAISGFMYGMLPFLAMPAAAVLGASIIGLVLTEGIIAAVEIPGLLGNVMSYLRIAAVGVGGVIIAEAINELLMPRLELSPAGIIVFIITSALYIVMHFAACVLAMFESLVHGARLNVVEFFGKFYKGGGVAFSPFSARRVHTQEA